MNDAETGILKEIRDLLKSREEKYDQYLKQAGDTYKKQAQAARLNLLWWIIAVAIGVYIGGLMLFATLKQAIN